MPGYDGMLYFTVGCESPSTQMLLQWSKEVKITRCQVRAVGRMVQYLRALYRRNNSRVRLVVCGLALSCSNTTPLRVSVI
jgi:hypothetical protein